MTIKYVVESHTGPAEGFDLQPDHSTEYDTMTAALSAIARIFRNSALNSEHQSPIVRLLCVREDEA